MSTRQSGRLQPFSPLSPKPIGASYHLDPRRTHERPAMSFPAQVETRHTEETLSLTSLESDADDFDRRMIQTARDARRLNDAPTPKVHAFSKARVHPRVGVTLENLERHNSRTNVSNPPSRLISPPSSSGSARSDPALNVPSGWGRKARVKRDWMRTITAEDSRGSQVHEDATDRIASDPEETPRRGADEPRQSIEDSPLSHKSFLHGTPLSQRRRSIDEWSFDMNEASLIASTPYRPRNTILDNIRQREIESLREQHVATSRLDKTRDGSSEEVRQPSTKSTEDQRVEVALEPVSPSQSASEPRLHRRTNSWQAVGKAPALTGQGLENSPIVVYKKSSETIGMVDGRLLANQATPARRPPNRKDDSHDLLRRLARASSTPSPGPSRTEVLPSQTTSMKQLGSSSQTAVADTSPLKSTAAKDVETVEKEAGERLRNARPFAHVDVTPESGERSILDPKTPVVTGAWVDTMLETPASTTTRQPAGRPQASSPRKHYPIRKAVENLQPTTRQEEPQQVKAEVSRPDLPRSVLDAIVEQARASGRQRPTDYGDSTINSLEELIAPLAGTPESGGAEEDTMALDIPSAAPRNESERRRQEELLHIREMDQKLRSTRTSLRDTSRGIRRVEEQIERNGQSDGRSNINEHNADREGVVHREHKCPCADNGHAQFSLWNGFKLLFYDSSHASRPRRRGLTWLSVLLLTLITWFVLENICCEIWGHHMYASSYKEYGVVWGAPEYPYALPTMTYRAFVRPWWRPLYASARWIWKSLGVGTEDVVQNNARMTAAKIAERILVKEQARVTFEEDTASILGMSADEVVR